ncbi:MAG TPA: glycosyltransferase [Chloroflexota bacterium]|jgi:rhamnosyltransferase|nr:glycosyltransferase [Chloroflexota bacterium]
MLSAEPGRKLDWAQAGAQEDTTTYPTRDPLISVVVRTFNEQTGLPVLLEGLRAQRESRFEVVVVDSGSTDRTREIAANCRDMPVRLVELQHFTYGRALNVGVEAARGRFIAFLSAHVEILSDDWLGEMVRACSRPGVAAAFSRQVPWLFSPWYERLFVWWMYGRHIRVPALPPFSFTNAATMIRRECWARRRFDEALAACEDYEWASRVLRCGYRLVWVPGVAVRHSHDEDIVRFLGRRYREGKVLCRVIAAHLAAGRDDDGGPSVATERVEASA